MNITHINTTGIWVNGIPVCLSNGTNCVSSIGDTQKATTGDYLYNDSAVIYFNETQLNITIDSRELTNTTLQVVNAIINSDILMR